MHAGKNLTGYAKVIHTHTHILGQYQIGRTRDSGLQCEGLSCTVNQTPFSSLVGGTKKPPVSRLMTDYA